MINPDDLEYLKAYFVTRADCDAKTDEINGKLSSDMTKLAVIESRLNTIIWQNKTILAAVATAIVGAIMTLILK